MLYEAICVIGGLLVVWYIYLTNTYLKEVHKGIKTVPFSFPFGDTITRSMCLGKVAMAEVFQTAFKIPGYENEKAVISFMFGRKMLTIADEELTKRILIKDFDHFVDRRAFSSEKDNKYARVVNNFLVNMKGDEWKRARIMMSGLFTSGKLKTMAPHIIKVGMNMEAYLDSILPAEGPSEIIESKEFATKFTLDAIATSGFGIEIDTFKDPDNVFAKMVKKLQERPPLFIVEVILWMLIPLYKKFRDLPFFQPQALEFFTNIVEKTYRQRIESGQRRNDIIDLMVDEMKKFEKEQQESSNEAEGQDQFESEFERDAALSKEDVERLKKSQKTVDREAMLLSNILLFFVAGFDTTSSTFAMMCHFLVHNPEIQERVHEEIMNVLDSGEVTFDKVQEMRYMDQVLNECGRLQESVAVLERQCTKDYKIPDTDYVVKKGEIIRLYTGRTARDGKNFVNPAEFDPENFDPNNNPNKFAMSLFGHGPRNCIGMRYGLMAIKLCLVFMLRKFRMVKCEKTLEKPMIDMKTLQYIDYIVMERR